MHSTLKTRDPHKRQITVQPTRGNRKTLAVSDGAAITLNGKVARLEDLQAEDVLETKGTTPCTKIDARRVMTTFAWGTTETEVET